jgi:DNA polymerase-3 subunit delta'
MLFSEVVGQKEIKERLLYLAKNEKVPHALLFTGQEGVGKLAMALAFSQYINCQKPLPQDSCNDCASCHKFSNLIHPDLHFVFPIYKGTKSKVVCDDFIKDWRDFLLVNAYFKDSQWYYYIAEDKGQPMIYADEVNEIIEKINVKNYEAKYKVIIIYQPERMHIATANKLLKSLEEPPPFTLFILISSQPELLLPTIVSRCQIIKFPLIDDKSLISFIKEKYPTYEEKDIIQTVLLANGSLPSAIELLEKHENLKAYFDLYVKMMRLAYELKHKTNKTEEQIKFVHEVVSLSKENQKEFLIHCLRITKNNFLLNNKLKSLVIHTKEEEAFSEKFAKFIPFEVATNAYKYFSDAIYHIERNGNSRIIFTDLIYKVSNLF